MMDSSERARGRFDFEVKGLFSTTESYISELLKEGKDSCKELDYDSANVKKQHAAVALNTVKLLAKRVEREALVDALEKGITELAEKIKDGLTAT